MRNALKLLLLIVACLSVTDGLWAQGSPVEIWIRAFIPNPAGAGQANGYIVAVPGGSVVRLRNADPQALNLCFATDDRGFSTSSSSTSRSETLFTITPKSATAATVTPLANRTNAAVTRKVDCNSGAVLDHAPGKVVRDTIGTPAVADGTVQVLGQVEAKNVLTPLGNSGPAIDYSFDVKWHPADSTLTIAITYGVFPSLEIYARRPGGQWVTVIQRSPAGQPWQLGGDSFGVNSTREVQTTTIP
jgi:hypothetical protein